MRHITYLLHTRQSVLIAGGMPKKIAAAALASLSFLGIFWFTRYCIVVCSQLILDMIILIVYFTFEQPDGQPCIGGYSSRKCSLTVLGSFYM